MPALTAKGGALAKLLQEVELGAPELEELARAYSPALKRFFERRKIKCSDVDDLVQEVFLRLARRGDLQNVTNPDGYIFQTAANTLRDRLRRRLSHHVSDHQPIDDDCVEDAAFSPERVLLGKEAFDRLSKGVRKLPARTSQVFILCRVDELTYAEIAEQLDISVSSVAKHMAKALDFLMEYMKDDFQC